MSTKRPALRPADPQLSPALAVLLILAVCLVAWAVVCALVIGTLMVAGSTGLVLLGVVVAAVTWHWGPK